VGGVSHAFERSRKKNKKNKTKSKKNHPKNTIFMCMFARSCRALFQMLLQQGTTAAAAASGMKIV
jgi:hypothetical protein